jgi:hypothetical protein
MIRWVSVGLLTLSFGVAGGASAEPSPSPFPLADGNRWTLRNVETNAAKTVSVRKEPEGFVVSGLPGAPALRVRWVGETLQAWDTADERWEAIFRFGGPAGKGYPVSLRNTLLWRNVVVTLTSKRATVEDFGGRTRNCVRFTFGYKRGLADAGLESMSFAPGIGPVRIADQTIAGTRELALAGYRVK